MTAERCKCGTDALGGCRLHSRTVVERLTVVRDEWVLRAERAEAALAEIAAYDVVPAATHLNDVRRLVDVARMALGYCVCGYDKDSHEARNGHCPLRLKTYQPLAEQAQEGNDA